MNRLQRLIGIHLGVHIGLFICLFSGAACSVHRIANSEPPASVTPSPTLPPTLPPAASPTSSPLPLPSITINPSPPLAPVMPDASGALIIPVVGVRPEQLQDTYNDARSEGRVHNAIDIMAACGTPVIAATTGKIMRFFNSEKGGVTLYQLGPDERTVYYYAHLSRYADGITEGQTVQQGQLIAYVGDTGNAQPGNCHLHFAIWTVSDPKRFWSGEDQNPYPLLRRTTP